MLDDLYDTVFSIMNESGYIDRALETEDKTPLHSSYNKKFPFYKENINTIGNQKYPVKVFSHDLHIFIPNSFIIEGDE